MNKNIIFWIAGVVFAVAGWWIWQSGYSGADRPIADFKEAVYEINGREMRLEGEADPETKMNAYYFGNEASGDLNGDGLDDVIFLLTLDGGGSGTFFYVAAALKTADGYAGQNAVFLGDRIAPQTTEIFNGIVYVNYAERKENDPMTTRPSVGVTKYLNFSGGALAEIIIQAGEQLMWGNIVMGHEVRSFRSCQGNHEYWIMGDSPAYKKIADSYQELLPAGSKPYTPIFGALIGRIVKSPVDGFGADYDNALSAREIISASPTGRCR